MKIKLFYLSAVASAVAGFSIAGCSNLPQVDYLKLEALDHVSHLTAGKPFGPRNEEDCITQSNILIGFDEPFGKNSYLEGGVGYMWTDEGFYGPRFTATARAGKKFQFGRK